MSLSLLDASWVRSRVVSRLRATGMLILLPVLAVAWSVSAATAQKPGRAPRDPSPHSDVELVPAMTSAAPGERVTVAVRLTLDKGWHTYWTNPGDAGLPLEVKWTLPAAVTASPLQFPTPHLAPQPPLMSFGYENEVFVLTDVQIPATASVGSSVRITGEASWLACADVCLPASGPLLLEIPIGVAGSPTRWAGAINATRAAVPVASATLTSTSWATKAGYILVLTPAATDAAAMRKPYFFPDSVEVLEHAMPQRVARAGDTLVFALPRSIVAEGMVAVLRGIVSPDVDAESPRAWVHASTVSASPSASLRARAGALLAEPAAFDVGGVGAVPATVESAAAALPDPGADMSFFAAAAFAFIGGLLLNLMPCVFPVLSVKVLALIEHAGAADPARGRRHGLAFAAGVLLSFWVLAGVLIALRAGGEQLGWGFQLQSPPVVALLALLIFALALNLSGVFEIGLTLTRLGGVGTGAGYGDSLLTGGLAVAVAAPCTAPFMGAALGYALVQPALIGLMVFTALGLGLALPFVLLASAPNLLRFLPRPGPWLETLKQLFAFPLYATVVWLLWVLGQQVGIDALAIVLLAMILLALGAWTWARGVRNDRATTRLAAAALMLGAIAMGFAGGTRPAVASASASAAPAGWEPWSVERVAQLQQEGRPVFVDFTAAWCLSCQVNERVALRAGSVQRAFSEANVALLRADWTSRDTAITAVLASFGRSGVPLYVLYPAGSGGKVAILPAVLSPGIVVDAVKVAAPTVVASHGVR